MPFLVGWFAWRSWDGQEERGVGVWCSMGQEESWILRGWCGSASLWGVKRGIGWCRAWIPRNSRDVEGALCFLSWQGDPEVGENRLRYVKGWCGRAGRAWPPPQKEQTWRKRHWDTRNHRNVAYGFTAVTHDGSASFVYPVSDGEGAGGNWCGWPWTCGLWWGKPVWPRGGGCSGVRRVMVRRTVTGWCLVCRKYAAVDLVVNGAPGGVFLNLL